MRETAINFTGDLNPRQREAVEAVDGPLLINAGPGSGKTRVITHRIAHLVHALGVPTGRVAAVTFTNKAAAEMRERVKSLLGGNTDGLTVATFHSFCSSVLRLEGDRVGLDRSFTIYDDSDQMAVIKQGMEQANLDPKKFAPRAILSAISKAKSSLINVEDFRLTCESPYDETVHAVFEIYERLMGQNSALDFDDLLFKVYQLFTDDTDIASRYQERYLHFMVDEFQDTNVAQYAIAKQIAKKHRNICVVGDPDQAIYSWRNADIRNILSFRHDYPDAHTIDLEENYRSTETILAASQHLISSNDERVHKELWTNNGKGEQIVIAEGYDQKEEAILAVREIERLVDESGYRRKDVAVMYRVNAQSMTVELACSQSGLPYQLVGSVRFYQRQEIKDVTAYMRLIINPNDDVSFSRVVNTPRRGVGQRTLNALEKIARGKGTSLFEAASSLDDTGPGTITSNSKRAVLEFCRMIKTLITKSDGLELASLIDELLNQTGYKNFLNETVQGGQERWENIVEYRNSAKEFETIGTGRDTLVAFLERVSLVSDTDHVDDDLDAVTLTTLHQAKGLEFPVVFIIGMEEGVLPHVRSLDEESEIEEERRLCYVGFTRAKERLYLLRAFRRGFPGMTRPSLPSRFLSNLSENLTTFMPYNSYTSSIVENRESIPIRTKHTGSQPRKIETQTGSSKLEINTGDKVRHARFGEGIVTNSKVSGNDLEITVAFDEGNGVKRLLLSFAPLEKI